MVIEIKTVVPTGVLAGKRYEVNFLEMFSVFIWEVDPWACAKYVKFIQWYTFKICVFYCMWIIFEKIKKRIAPEEFSEGRDFF